MFTHTYGAIRLRHTHDGSAIRSGAAQRYSKIASHVSEVRPFGLRAAHRSLEAEIKNFVIQSPSNSCSLDPLTTWLLKNNLDVLMPALIQIVNIFMISGNVSDSLKESFVKPLKKNNLDSEQLKNFRPVSNLSFASKLMDRAVATRPNNCISEHGLHNIFQSVYKKRHSNKTVIPRISDDVLRAMDNKKCA